jgi:hypothetical protein
LTLGIIICGRMVTLGDMDVRRDRSSLLGVADGANVPRSVLRDFR